LIKAANATAPADPAAIAPAGVARLFLTKLKADPTPVLILFHQSLFELPPVLPPVDPLPVPVSVVPIAVSLAGILLVLLPIGVLGLVLLPVFPVDPLPVPVSVVPISVSSADADGNT